MTKISALTPLVGASVAGDDLLTMVDVSSSDKNRKITFDEFVAALGEPVQDAVAGLLTAGTNVTLTYDDGAGTLTIDVASPSTGDITGFNEAVDDRVAALLQAGTNISLVYNDGAGTLTITSAGTYTDEQARDAVGNALTDAGLAVVTVDDVGDTIDINVPAAVASDLNTGTDTTKAVTSDALAGSNFGKAVFQVWLSDLSTAITTGDGKAYFVVPAALNGMNLVAVKATLVVAQSTSGIPTVQIANVTDAVDMLSTKLTIDANETDSATAATAAVIDTTKDDVATGDILRFDIDVAGTGAKGLVVTVTFQLP